MTTRNRPFKSCVRRAGRQASLASPTKAVRFADECGQQLEEFSAVVEALYRPMETIGTFQGYYSARTELQLSRGKRIELDS